MRAEKTERDAAQSHIPDCCRDCAKLSSCSLYHNAVLRANCPIWQDEETLSCRNHEGYVDPTAYYALRNVAHERKAKQ